MERRYVTDDLVTSDIATIAARQAITSSGIDLESLDYIIVAHNPPIVSLIKNPTIHPPNAAADSHNAAPDGLILITRRILYRFTPVIIAGVRAGLTFCLGNAPALVCLRLIPLSSILPYPPSVPTVSTEVYPPLIV